MNDKLIKNIVHLLNAWESGDYARDYANEIATIYYQFLNQPEEFMDFSEPKNWKEFKNDTWDNSNVDPIVQAVSQEPVAWMNKDGWIGLYKQGDATTPLFPAPPKREWVGLTDDEVAEAVGSPLDEVYMADFRKVEAKLKEKNT